MNYTDKEYLAKGKRGLVYTAMLGKRKIIIKELNPASSIDTIAHEAQMLSAVNAKGIGPVLIGLERGSLLREFIDGQEIMDWIPTVHKAAVKEALIGVVAQCRALDVLGINKLEMTHPHKHILMRKNKPVFIDFDRARYAEKPKNVTQVCQWITGAQMRALLEEKNIMLPRDSLQVHAKSYKENYSAVSYRRIIEAISNA